MQQFSSGNKTILVNTSTLDNISKKTMKWIIIYKQNWIQKKWTHTDVQCNMGCVLFQTERMRIVQKNDQQKEIDYKIILI